MLERRQFATCDRERPVQNYEQYSTSLHDPSSILRSADRDRLTEE